MYRINPVVFSSLLFTRFYCCYFKVLSFVITLLFFSGILFAQTKKNGCDVEGSVTTTPACIGASNGTVTVTLTGSQSENSGTYNINGGPSQPFTTNPFTIPGFTAGNYSVIVTLSASGCIYILLDVNIAVSTLPLPVVTANATVNPICTGSSTNLNASGASTYTWMPGSLTGSSVSVSPSSSTQYTVTGANAHGCSISNKWTSVSGGGYHSLAIKTDGTLWAWGNNQNGQLGDGTLTDRNSPVQVGTANDWVSVSSGNYHSLALKSNGTLWAWGFNSTGQLGDGSIVNRSLPVQVGAAVNWSKIAAGGSHSHAIKTDGSLWAWGANAYGQIGDGTGTQRTSPVQIGVAVNWASVSGGSDHTIAVKTDGSLWAWGRNTFGQLGDGTTTLRTSPVQIGVSTNWSKISACFFHNVAIRTDGSLWAWGYNINGQLGDGTTTQKTSPVQTGIATDWTEVEGGLYNSLGRKTNGTIWGWGLNNYGQLGDGTTLQRTSPVQSGAATNWSKITGGLYHTQGIRSDGSIWSWGYNNNGQIGDGTNSNRLSAVQINSNQVGVFITVNPLPAVSFSGLAATYCQAAPAVNLTGSPTAGVFSGPGISGNSFNPSTAGVGNHTVIYTFTDINGCVNSASQQVAVTFTDLLDFVNLQSPGVVSVCQGVSTTVYGQVFESGVTEPAGAGAGITAELGYNTVNTNPSTWLNWQPASFHSQADNNDQYASTLNLPAGTYYVAYRYTYTLNGCGFQYGGYSATGGNTWDGLNNISMVLTVNAPPTISANASPAAICSGSSTTLSATGASVFLWMPGNLSGASVPVAPITNTTYTVTGTSAAGCSGGNSWAVLSAGGYHNLGLKTDGSLWTMGVNDNGQIGDGTNSLRLNPVKIGTALNWVKVSAGSFHSLAIKSDGTLWAWGSNVNGQLGDGTTTDRNTPVQIGSATDWASISAGGSHNLALKTDGTLWAWGLNTYGQIGDGTGTQRNSPVKIGIATNWWSISGGGSHSLAIKNDGSLWAWGRGNSGQLGDGTAADRNAPVQIGVDKKWKRLAACFFHSAALKNDGTLWTWGRNMEGQIGDGTTVQRNSPIQVGTGTNWNAVDGSLNHTMGIKNDGTLWSWGSNLYGQLGDGTQTAKLIPIQTGIAANWMLLDGGSYHSMSVRNDGTLWAWGRNMEGQLGNGTSLTFQLTPVQIGTNNTSVSVTVNALPSVTANASPASICSGASSTLTAGGALTYSWMPGAISGASVSVSPVTQTVYTVTGTNANGCTNTASTTVFVKQLPTVAVNNNSPVCTSNDAIFSLSGTPGASVTYSLDGGNSAAVIPLDGSGNATVTVLAATTSQTLSLISASFDGCTNNFNTQSTVTVNVCPTFTTLNLTVFLEGFYSDISSMRANIYDLGISTDPSESDTITVNLWNNSNLSNLDPDYSLPVVVHTDGAATAQFPVSVTGSSFYIAIKHRNHIETWSATPVSFTTTTVYNFSTGLGQAYNDGVNPPMAAMAGGVYAIYGGDVNQDGTVDASDQGDVDNDNNIFAFGYNITDCTGDGSTDASDQAVTDNNNILFLFYARPY